MATRNIESNFGLSRLIRESDTSAVNTAKTVSEATATLRKVLFVTIKYSGAAGVTATVTLNSGAGAAFDTRLQDIVFSAQTDGVWIPDGDVILQDDDVLDVLAPAVVGETSAITIYSGVL